MTAKRHGKTLNLRLDASLAQGYTSNSQRSRRMTEGWATANLYCIVCDSPKLSPHRNNRAVEDFYCPSCQRQVQLKAENGGIGRTVSNSAYEKKVAAIAASRAPDYCFLGYDGDALMVDDLLWIPGHFITLSVVSKRNPLRKTARRSGWVGSNIHLDRVPDHGKIPLIVDRNPRPVLQVRKQFQATAFMQRLLPERRGWLADVLACMDNQGIQTGQQFTNADLYSLEDYLAPLHPRNHNLRPKIRQQLQVLARHGLVERVRPGTYRRL